MQTKEINIKIIAFNLKTMLLRYLMSSPPPKKISHLINSYSKTISQIIENARKSFCNKKNNKNKKNSSNNSDYSLTSLLPTEAKVF